MELNTYYEVWQNERYANVLPFEEAVESEDDSISSFLKSTQQLSLNKD